MADREFYNLFQKQKLRQKPAADKTLVSRLIASLVYSDFHDPKRDYVPETCFMDLVTNEVVEAEFMRDGELPDTEDRLKSTANLRKEVVPWVCKQSRKTFAIAVQCHSDPEHLLLSMAIFKKTNLDDTRLPLDEEQKTIQIQRHFDNTIWSDLQIRQFYTKQWECTAAVFSSMLYNYNFLHNCILPFNREDVTPKVGAFGAVHKVRIHEDHQTRSNMRLVAIKEINVTRGNDSWGTQEAWEKEAGALANINKLKHMHITECVAAIRRGSSRYFMFPWADGDSLRDYWVRTPRQTPGPQPELICEAIQQLRGLADALHCLHYCNSSQPMDEVNDADFQQSDIPEVQVQDEHDERTDLVSKIERNAKSIRHGDLKPENILRFLDQRTKLGTLKLADMGLAKQHILVTGDRTHLTSTRYGTVQYEAPEALGKLPGPRSRLYDVWSMGCITFEFIIWLLYGNDQLNIFYEQLKGDTQQYCQYYELTASGESRRLEVHKAVRQWIKAMQETDPECSGDTAIADLLCIVQKKLLVVPLPPSRESAKETGRLLAPPAVDEPLTRYRVTAQQFREELDSILAKIKTRPGYLYTEKPRANVQLPMSMLAAPLATKRHDSSLFSESTPAQAPIPSGVLSHPIKTDDYRLPPLKDWVFSVEEKLVTSLSSHVEPEEFSPKPKDQCAKLCRRCQSLVFWEGGFSFDDDVSELENRSKFCDFCKLLSGVSVKADGSKWQAVGFERKQSTLLIVGEPFPVLSIFRSYESKPPLPIQLGFPEPPQPRTETSFEIMKKWLANCDSDTAQNSKHRDCHNKPESVPTRLIDVGSLERPLLRLIVTSEEKILTKRYIALSHPWGDTKKYLPFCTLQANIHEYRQQISYDKLPATFQDAVDCTRKLNIRYLWIDSLCIIQGYDGDFAEESKRIENVFSDAYCVLAASRATNQQDGFLGPRRQRGECVTFERGTEKPFYVCKTIDNFNQDVIEGSLNKRGWVLQERALAHRTIYFTEKQTYFECGDGVQCETMTKMQNNMADFLGDPKFPAKAMKAKRATRIAYFQGLYKQYSRLDFTRYDDRPFAIAGLEKRLRNAFDTKGGFGIFDDGDKLDRGLFHRSLLWKRGEEEGDAEYLTPIEFSPERNVRVPSWSWMAYKGGIDFIDPPFRSAHWETRELTPPWTRGGGSRLVANAAPLHAQVAIEAVVRRFDVAGRLQNEVRLSYDTERRTASDGQRAQCVIVARERDGLSDRGRRYYVLLVVPTSAASEGGRKTYQRVGVGFMLGKFITLEGEGVQARIV